MILELSLRNVVPGNDVPFDEFFVLDLEITIVLFWMSYRVNEDRIQVHAKCIEVHASACHIHKKA